MRDQLLPHVPSQGFCGAKDDEGEEAGGHAGHELYEILVRPLRAEVRAAFQLDMSVSFRGRDFEDDDEYLESTRFASVSERCSTTKKGTVETDYTYHREKKAMVNRNRSHRS